MLEELAEGSEGRRPYPLQRPSPRSTQAMHHYYVGEDMRAEGVQWGILPASSKTMTPLPWRQDLINTRKSWLSPHVAPMSPRSSTTGMMLTPTLTACINSDITQSRTSLLGESIASPTPAHPFPGFTTLLSRTPFAQYDVSPHTLAFECERRRQVRQQYSQATRLGVRRRRDARLSESPSRSDAPPANGCMDRGIPNVPTSPPAPRTPRALSYELAVVDAKRHAFDSSSSLGSPLASSRR